MATVLLRVAVMNSADVVLCDFIETQHNEKIGIIKDIEAAAVGIALFVWLLVLGFEVEEMLCGLS